MLALSSDKRPRPGLLRTCITRTGLIFLGITLALVLIELFVRVGERSFLRQRSWSDRPSVYYKYEPARVDHDYRYPAIKPQGGYRIAVLGDSFSYPTYMQFDDAYAKRLERMLRMNTPRANRPPAEVISFAHKGASTRDEIRDLKMALRFSPDVVLLQITLNDPQPRSLHRLAEVDPKYEVFLPSVLAERRHPILRHWRSLEFARERLRSFRTYSALKNYYLEMYSGERSWRSFTKNMRRLAKVARNAKVPLVAVVFPMFDYPFDGRYPLSPAHEKIDKLLLSLQIPHLDLLSAYAGIPNDRLQVKPGKDSHPNEIAHRIAADRIYTWLSHLPLFPPDLRVHQTPRHEGSGWRSS